MLYNYCNTNYNFLLIFLGEPTMNTQYNTNNVFYKILQKEISCNVVAENNNALAFYDINPQAPLHVLVIPKGNYVNAVDFFSNATSLEILDFNALVVEVVEKLNVTKGFRLISNNGNESGQEVPHYHMHILGGKQLGKLLDN